MTINISELRGRRNQLCANLKKLMAETKDKPWTAENQTQYDNFTNEVSSIDGQLHRHQQILDLEADTKFNDAKNIDYDTKDPKNVLRTLHNKWLRGGDSALNADEWGKLRAAVQNTMSTGTGSQGGYTVPSLIASQLIDSVKGYRGVREVAQSLVTETGNALSFPTSDGTSEVGELIPENTTANAADPTFGTVAVNCYKFSSKIIAVPIELLQDTVIDMEAFINGRIRDRIGRIGNQYFTTGSGTGQPGGVASFATAGKLGATGQTTSIIFDDLIDMQDALDYGYDSTSIAWMMAQSSRKVVRKIKDSTGRPIWAPGEGNMIDGFSETLLGKSLVLNNDVAAMAANAKSILYGDFSRYVVRDAMQVSLYRFTDSPYTKLGQVGFLAWVRSGGNLLDTSAVKYYQNSAT